MKELKLLNGVNNRKNIKDEKIKSIIETYLKNNHRRPHDVKIIITFKDDNTHEEIIINWETISAIKALHNTCAVSEIYQASI